jgi:2-amino-4-hydroxy-6-hydroxymethyldihydropteridine diphosphokinase
MTRCYLGLGSNLRSPERQLRQALAKIRTLPQTTIKRVSSFYVTPPFGLKAQPDYHNIVIAIDTNLPPLTLLNYCQYIENKHHRLRKKRFGARTLDIDILLYGEQTIHHRRLTVPHPQMLNRDFVLLPLREIAPCLTY